MSVEEEQQCCKGGGVEVDMMEELGEEECQSLSPRAPLASLEESDSDLEETRARALRNVPVQARITEEHPEDEDCSQGSSANGAELSDSDVECAADLWKSPEPSEATDAEIRDWKRNQPTPLKSILKKATNPTEKKPKKVEIRIEEAIAEPPELPIIHENLKSILKKAITDQGGLKPILKSSTKGTQTKKVQLDEEDVRYEISVKEEIFMTVVVKNGEVTKFEKTVVEPDGLGEALALKLRELKTEKRERGSSSSEGSVEEEKDLDREKDQGGETDSEEFEDCEDYCITDDYEDEACTDFGCGGYYGESPLQTIEEEEEEDSELEQFEQLEQLCSSDDFDPEELIGEDFEDLPTAKKHECPTLDDSEGHVLKEVSSEYDQGNIKNVCGSENIETEMKCVKGTIAANAEQEVTKLRSHYGLIGAGEERPRDRGEGIGDSGNGNSDNGGVAGNDDGLIIKEDSPGNSGDDEVSECDLPPGNCSATKREFESHHRGTITREEVDGVYSRTNIFNNAGGNEEVEDWLNSNIITCGRLEVVNNAEINNGNEEKGDGAYENRETIECNIERTEYRQGNDNSSVDLLVVDNKVEGTKEGKKGAEEERIQSYRQYKKFLEAKGNSPKGGYRNQLEAAKDSKSGGSKIRSALGGAGATSGGGSIGEGRRRDPAGIDRGGGVDIFSRGYDFESDGWFVGGRANDRQAAMRHKRAEEPGGGGGADVGGGAVKSALKRAPAKKKKKNKVQFDEALNVFYESDYVIIIREEGECEGEGCICGGAYYYEEDYDDEEEDDVSSGRPVHVQRQEPQLAGARTAPLGLAELCCSASYFDPPVEFVDQLTLSPPDGYKDLNVATQADQDETENWVEDECQEAKEPPKLEDNTTQTTPTSDGESNIPEIPTQTESSYIAEPVTMTTTANSRDLADEEKREGSQATVTFSEDTTIVDTDDDTTQEQKQEHQQRPEHQKIPDRTEEMAVTFRLGNVMMANSLKPNSAVRQLFPSPRFVSPPPGRSPEDDGITGGKKSPESDEDDGLQNNLIKRTIERNTLRRSMLRYPADIRLKRNQNRVKNDNSLVERIKKLTCDLDEETEPAKEERTSPTGEESSDAIGYLGLSSPCLAIAPTQHTSFRRIPDLYARKEPHPVVLQAPASVEHQYPYYRPMYTTTTPVPPDLGNGVPPHPPLHLHLSAVPPQQVMLPPPAPPPTSLPQQHPPKPAHPRASVTAEARKQFLSTLAPLAACVSSNKEDAQDMLLSPPGTRDSLASSSAATDNTEYSIGDIDDALKTETVPKPRPDVVAGTPGNEQPTDELAVFVQQDASRIERLRKRYSGGSTEQEEPPYQQQRPEFGFDRRPSVRGIKPRFGSTTEILQQMQSQMTPPLPAAGGGHVSWPYYADAGKTPPGVNGYHRRPQQFLQARLPEYGDDALYPQGQLQRAGPRPAFRAGGMQLQQVVEAPRQVVVRGTQTISTGYYGVPPRPPPLFYYPGGSPVPCGSPTKMKLERGVPEGASASPALHHEQACAPPPLQHNAMMYAMNV